MEQSRQPTTYSPEDIQPDLAPCQVFARNSVAVVSSLTLDDFLINEILQLLERRTCAVVLGDTGFIDAPTINARPDCW